MSTALAIPAPEEHSEIGGSVAGRIVACPGSIRRMRRLKRLRAEEHAMRLASSMAAIVARKGPVDAAALVDAAERHRRMLAADGASIWAEEGTALHECVAEILSKDLDTQDVVGRIYNVGNPIQPQGFAMTPDLVRDVVRPAVSAFEDYLDRVAEEDGEEPTFRIEKRVRFPGIAGAFGTCDLIVSTWVRTCVWDWKFGGGVKVDAFGNKQLMFYAAGGIETFPEMFGDRTDGRRLDLVICQPRIDVEPRIWETTLASVYQFQIDLTDAVEAALDETREAPLLTGDHCRFAECKAVCPLHAGAAGELARKMAKLVPGAPEVVEEGPKTLPELLTLLLDVADVVEPLVGEARKQAKALVESGGDLPGWMLEPRKSAGREWIDEKQAAKKLKAMGLDDYEIHVMDVVSPAAAEKHLKAKKLLKSKDRLPEDLTTMKPSSGANLVRRSAAGPELIPTPKLLAALATKLARV